MSSSRDKKGLSEVIGYVLLVVIAIVISILVYSYLELLAPKEKSVCPEDISMIISQSSCSGGSLQLTLSNTGRFTVPAVYIRLGRADRDIRSLIQQDYNPFSMGSIKPGEERQSTFTIDTAVYNAVRSNNGGSGILEIQPAVGSSQNITLCEKAIISQPIVCS